MAQRWEFERPEIPDDCLVVSVADPLCRLPQIAWLQPERALRELCKVSRVAGPLRDLPAWGGQVRQIAHDSEKLPGHVESGHEEEAFADHVLQPTPAAWAGH